jgi:hypothetical protein
MVLLSTSPTDQDGNPTSVIPVWTSSNPEQVGLEVSEDGLTAWALTPLLEGSAIITVSATGFQSATIEISYSEPIPGQLNLSAGTPITD